MQNLILENKNLLPLIICKNSPELMGQNELNYLIGLFQIKEDKDKLLLNTIAYIHNPKFTFITKDYFFDKERKQEILDIINKSQSLTQGGHRNFLFFEGTEKTEDSYLTIKQWIQNLSTNNN